jgi:hypothetical protein
MASVLTDISTHIVIRVYIKAIANRVGITHFKKGLLDAGLRTVTANRERRKIDTSAGLLATAGKKFIWHIYVLPITGPTFGFNCPKKILIDVDGDKYAIDYAIRASLELGGQDSNLCLHYGLRNCKGYNADEGKTLLDKKLKIRICACEENKEQANSRKARRIELKDVDVRVALKAPPSKDCSRFLNGICLLNKKGKKCSSNHNIKDAWVTSPEGKICCTIECALKPHSMLQGCCMLGKDCLYKHTKKCAALYYFHSNLCVLTNAFPFLASGRSGALLLKARSSNRSWIIIISVGKHGCTLNPNGSPTVDWRNSILLAAAGAWLQRRGSPKASARGVAASGSDNFRLSVKSIQNIKLVHQRRRWGRPRPSRKAGHLT